MQEHRGEQDQGAECFVGHGRELGFYFKPKVRPIVF